MTLPKQKKRPPKGKSYGEKKITQSKKNIKPPKFPKKGY